MFTITDSVPPLSKLFWIEGSGSRTVYKQGSVTRSAAMEVARYPAITGRESAIMFHPELMKYVFLRDKVLYLYNPSSRDVFQIDTNGEDVKSFSLGPSMGDSLLITNLQDTFLIKNYQVS